MVAKRSNPWMKRIIFTVLILVVIFGTYFLISKFWGKNLYKAQTITAFDENNSSFLSLSADDKFIFYLDNFDQSLNKISLISQDSQPEKLGDLSFIPKDREITNLRWSPDQSKIYVFTFLEGTPQIYFYDLVNKQSKPMDENIIDIDFSGDKAVYIFSAENENYLVTSNYDGSGWKNLKTISQDYYDLKPSSDNQKIAIWGMGIEQGKSLKIFDINSGEINDIDSGVIGGVRFSPDNSKLLYSKAENDTIKIFTSDLKGQIENLDTAVYLDQFNWNGNDNIICISYAQIKDGTNFDFYTMQTKDNKKKLFNRIPNDSNNDPSNLTITKDGKTLFFTNNNQLQKVDL